MMDIDALPSDADNYDVWCERCRKVHPYYTMTREGFTALMARQAQALADEIDRRAADSAMRAVEHLYGGAR